MHTFPIWIRILSLLLVASTSQLGGPPRAEAADIRFEDLLISSFTTTSSELQNRVFTLSQDDRGRIFLEDRTAGDIPRRTSIGVTAPIGAAYASVLIGPDRNAWLALAIEDRGIELFDLGDPSVATPLVVTRIASAPVSRGFDPSSVRMGIIAILIGLVQENVPTLSFRDGSVHRVLFFDGAALLPFIEQDDS